MKLHRIAPILQFSGPTPALLASPILDVPPEKAASYGGTSFFQK